MVDCAYRRQLWLLLIVTAVAGGCREGSKRAGGHVSVAGKDAAAASGDEASLPAMRTPTPAGQMTPAPWLGGAERVAAQRVGDKVVVAAAHVGELRLHDADGNLLRTSAVPGTPHAMRFADVDRDGQPELVVGWGIGVASREAGLTLKVFDGPALDRVIDIDVGGTTRPQLVDIAVDGDGDVVVAHFASKYQVSLSKLDMAKKALTPMTRVRMLSGLDVVAREGQDKALGIARMYGDALGEPGGVFLFAGTEMRELPSLRGARAIRWSTEAKALIVADGWHREYAAKARPLISKIAAGPDGTWTRTVLANVAGRYGFTGLVLGDIDGDGRQDVVAVGDGAAVSVPVGSDGQGSLRELGGGKTTDAAIVDIDGDGRAEVVIAGSEPGIWRSGPAGATP